MKAYLISADNKPSPGPTRRAWWRFVERHLPMLIIYLMVVTLVAIVLAPHVLVTVPSGSCRRRFGSGSAAALCSIRVS